MFKRLYTLSFFTLILFISCDDKFREADVSELDQQCTFYSLTDSLAKFDLANAERVNQQLYQNLGEFWRDYTEGIIRVGPANDPSTLEDVGFFLHDPTINEINEAIKAVHHPRQREYQETLEAAFKRHAYFFPEANSPQVIFMNSGFNYGIYPIDRQMAIGMEWYLGAEHPITQSLDPQTFPEYLKRKMEPEFLIGDAVRGWLAVENQYKYFDPTDLISNCMYWGKILYLTDVMLPEIPDHQKINYSPAEVEWCFANERNLWITFSHQDVLYEKRKFEINRWINDGPFTGAQGVPQESPSRLGMWICWQVVRDYMERNPEVTPQQLLEEDNYLKILNAYRPG